MAEPQITRPPGDPKNTLLEPVEPIKTIEEKVKWHLPPERSVEAQEQSRKQQREQAREEHLALRKTPRQTPPEPYDAAKTVAPPDPTREPGGKNFKPRSQETRKERKAREESEARQREMRESRASEPTETRDLNEPPQPDSHHRELVPPDPNQPADKSKLHPGEAPARNPVFDSGKVNLTNPGAPDQKATFGMPKPYDPNLHPGENSPELGGEPDDG